MLSDAVQLLISESFNTNVNHNFNEDFEISESGEYDRFYIDEDTHIVRYTNFDGEEVYESSLLLEVYVNTAASVIDNATGAIIGGGGGGPRLMNLGQAALSGPSKALSVAYSTAISAVKGAGGALVAGGAAKAASSAGGALVVYSGSNAIVPLAASVARTAGGAAMAAPIAGAFKIGAGALALVAAAGAVTSTVMDFFRKKGVNEQEARIIADITNSASSKLEAMRPESTSFINFMSNMKTVGTGIAGAASAGADSLTSLTKAAGSAMTGTYNSINNAASDAYNEFVAGAGQVADSSKAYILSTADSIKVSVAELEKQREYHGKILNMIEKTPTDFKNIVISFFHKYGQTPFIKYLVDISQQNPAVFFAMLVAMTVVAIGAALGGTYLVARSIKSQSDAAKAIKSRENELARTSDDKRKKQIENEIGIIGAKGLVLSK